jgi:cell division protein ZapA
VSSHLKPVNITILGKEYKVACTADEQETLLSSARKLDRQMREIQDTGKINGGERIAVMVALNILIELHQLQHKLQSPEQEFAEKLLNLRHKIENVLENP